MEWLQKILSNAVYAADGKLDVEATMKKVNEEAPKHIIPKEQYNGKVKELETANETIGDLKKNNAGNEELQKTIKTHEGTIKQLKADHEKEIKGWLPYVTGCNWSDANNGYAGYPGAVIDAVEVYYDTPADIVAKYGYQKAQYRVAPIGGGYYPWQFDNEVGKGQDGYAGCFGVAFDKFQLY